MREITKREFTEKAREYKNKKMADARWNCFWIILSGLLASLASYEAICYWWEHYTQHDSLWLFGFLMCAGPLLLAPAMVCISHAINYYKMVEKEVEKKIIKTAKKKCVFIDEITEDEVVE